MSDHSKISLPGRRTGDETTANERPWRGEDCPGDDDDGQPTRVHLWRLKWITTLAPTIALYAYETIRHGLLDGILPTLYGNLIVGLLTLLLAYGFSELVFGMIDRLQEAAVERSREVAAWRAIAVERERLSRELHDSLAQVIAYLLVRIDTVEGLVAADRLAEATAELERLRATADDLYVDVRESISGLRIRVADKGLAEALAEHVDTLVERGGLAVDLEVSDRVGRLSPAIELQLFRVAQEALANVRRHACAQHARIKLARGPDDEILLSVSDDGRGFDQDKLAVSGQRAYGLATMRERVESLGGRLRIESRPGAGTRVDAIVPGGKAVGVDEAASRR